MKTKSATSTSIISRMNLSDSCTICERSLRSGDVARLLPCKELVHRRCWVELVRGEEEEDVTCPFCRERVNDAVDVPRRKNERHSNRDRRLVIETANKGGNWRELAATLGVNRSTAETWVKSGDMEPKAKGGNRVRVLGQLHVEALLNWLETDPQLTLLQMQARCLEFHNIEVSTSTISRALEGMCFTSKKVHYQPVGMNSIENKEKRKRFVECLMTKEEEGKIHTKYNFTRTSK